MRFAPGAIQKFRLAAEQSASAQLLNIASNCRAHESTDRTTGKLT